VLARIALTSFLCLQLFGAAALADKAFPPPPRNYIYDEPHLLSANETQEISAYLSNQDQKTGNQVLVAIFNSTDGEDFVDYTNRLFKTWNPGQKGKDNGVLLALFIKEKKSRIEVGYGLEPLLTDALTKRIMITVLKPDFQQAQYAQGIYKTVQAIHAVITDPATAQKMVQAQKGEPLPSWIFIILFGGIFGFFYLWDRFFPNTYTLGSQRSTRNRSPWDSGFGGGGFGGGGGWGSGSGGGGGFSGGGGSSGGGGASGDW
jgi:uncharacterized protein